MGVHSQELYYFARKEHKGVLNWEKTDSLQARVSTDISGHSEIVPYQHCVMLQQKYLLVLSLCSESEKFCFGRNIHYITFVKNSNTSGMSRIWICPHFISLLKSSDCKGYRIFFRKGSYLDTITVQAPHPPSPQPNLVPHKPTERTGIKENKNFGRSLLKEVSIRA